MPLSNPSVERALSFMNAVKVKPRNKMNPKMLAAIKRIRLGVGSAGCCRLFRITPEMYTLFNNSIYTAEQRVPRPPRPHAPEDEGGEDR